MNVNSKDPRGDETVGIRTEATITCPLCGAAARETMPVNACQRVYVCSGCCEMLRAREGNCCVFCSYADTVCPPKQADAQA